MVKLVTFTFWQFLEKNRKKTAVKSDKNFFSKNPATQNFQKYAQTRRNFCRPPNLGVVTLGPRKSFETPRVYFLTHFDFQALSNAKFHTIFYPKNFPPRQKFLAIGRFLGGGRNFWHKKNFFYVSTKSMLNIGDVIQIVVEIDRGGGHSHSNSTTSQSSPHGKTLEITTMCVFPLSLMRKVKKKALFSTFLIFSTFVNKAKKITVFFLMWF